jgi:hypothetical protein
MDASILRIKFKWTSRGRFWYEDGRWRLRNTKTIDMGKWIGWTNGRSRGQNNIDFRTSDDEPIVEK